MKHHTAITTAAVAAPQGMASGKYVPLPRAERPILSGDALAVPLKPHIRFDELMVFTGMKKSTLWAIQDPSASQYDPSFPPSYQLTARTKVWKTVEVLAWIESKLVVRRFSSEGASSDGEKLEVFK